MRTILLTRGLSAIVDDEDFARLSAHNWYAIDPSRNGCWYAARTKGRKIVYMHRDIVADGARIDHVDGDGLNNQRGNLRPASRPQNAMNQRKRRTGAMSSGFKGVGAHQGRWRARIQTDGKAVLIGVFPAEIAAANAYDQAARRHFGAFARLNFPYGIG